MTDNANDILAINQAANSILKHKVESLQIIPAVALKLFRLANDDNTKVSDLSQLIETEPTLAAKVLRNVNSAAFALSHKITSINRAVNILGFSAVRQLALNQLFYTKLISHKSKGEFDQLFFWQHCLFVATLSRSIAKALKHSDPDLIYCAGLIHDIGKIVFETHGKVSYSDFLMASKNDDQPLIKSEHDFFGLNHAEMGLVFCQQWDIPEQISAIVYCHHDLPRQDDVFVKYKADIAIINFANYIAWMQGLGSFPHSTPAELHVDVLSYIDIDQLDLESLLSDVDQEMQQTREFYGIKFPSLKALRATLIETAMLLSRYNKQLEKPLSVDNNVNLECLTTPHRSLMQEEIVPWTLSAIQRDFGFERLIMLEVNPKMRSLCVSYAFPALNKENALIDFSFKIDALSRRLLNSLRKKRAIILSEKEEDNKRFLQRFCSGECLLFPVLSSHRLIALLYVDNYKNKKEIAPQSISQLTPIIQELGVALTNAKCFELERKRAELDGLTGLLNKRMVLEHLTTTFQLDEKQLNRIAVGFIDIDYFKKFNDSCGHQAGDDALKIVAQIMRTLTRPSDFVGRYGGEEFVFVLHNATRQGALAYAERIRWEIERKGKILKQRFKGHALTISVGVSLYKRNYQRYTDIIEVADKAMYAAKQKGRNCIVVL